CMCYSPIRYAWDLTHHYLQEAGLTKGLKGWIAKYILHRIRMWDYRTANGVDEFIAISDFISKRITKAYRRKSTVIYPPVDTNGYSLSTKKGDYYLMASRMVPYKNTRLVVEAFSKMRDKKLIVVGDGPDMAKVKRIAGANVTLTGYQPFEELKKYMQGAKALIYAAEEDFGIIPVEAQACGTPVIAYGRGGALETVVEGKTGIFFDKRTVSDIAEVIEQFESSKYHFDPKEIRKNALRFSQDRFRSEFKSFIEKKIKEYFYNNSPKNSISTRILKLEKGKESRDNPGLEDSKIGSSTTDSGNKSSFE
ncbi:MAG: glycosyltransferase family 4 protein, partial [candidate division Zixibacteria bacterium]|nr:glycosyltransferase family 4 protein [candidate division Zixibacteria bacterium]